MASRISLSSVDAVGGRPSLSRNSWRPGGGDYEAMTGLDIDSQWIIK